MPDSVTLGGEFTTSCWENGRLLWEDKFSNGITAVGLLDVLNVMFRVSSQAAAWYIAPITLISDVSSADTLASHAGWTEVNATYDEATRPAWSPPTASGGKLKNTTTTEFTFNASTVCDGLMIASDNVKGSAGANTLWCTGKFSTPRTFAAGQQLRVFYELTATAV